MTLVARPTSAARLKEELEVRKLRSDILFAKLTFIGQIVNTIGLVILGGLVFLYFQRPQIEQMEITRLAVEKQQVSILAMNALALQNSQDRTSMLNAIHAMHPQYDFLGSLARSQTILTQVAAAPPMPEIQHAPPAKRPVVEAPPANGDREALHLAREKRVQLDELEARHRDLETICTKLHKDADDLKGTWEELKIGMQKELSGTVSERKPGRGPVYQSLFEQAIKVQGQLETTKRKMTQACAELEVAGKRREELIAEIERMLTGVFR
jgi:truncated hemoglobin YjbI